MESLASIATPALLLDADVVERNTLAMSTRVAERGLALRPHLKTAKCAEVAALATREHSGAITVSTPTEVAFFAERGYFEQTYAVCVMPEKLRVIANTVARHPGLRVDLICDSAQLIGPLDAVAREFKQRFRVLLEIDSGEHRSGLAAGSETLLATAAAIDASDSFEVDGVLTHAGHSYFCKTTDDIRRVAAAERESLVLAARRLRAAGFSCSVVSAGSTPTAVVGEDWTGVNELRPGVYCFFDLMQHSLGVCDTSDIALSVLATVISSNRDTGRIIVDAGALALSKDAGPGTDFGWVIEPGHSQPGKLRIRAVDQEHGYIDAAPESPPLALGSRIRILPNHACITASGHDQYWVTRNGQIVETWSRARGF